MYNERKTSFFIKTTIIIFGGYFSDGKVYVSVSVSVSKDIIITNYTIKSRARAQWKLWLIIWLFIQQSDIRIRCVSLKSNTEATEETFKNDLIIHKTKRTTTEREIKKTAPTNYWKFINKRTQQKQKQKQK